MYACRQPDESLLLTKNTLHFLKLLRDACRKNLIFKEEDLSKFTNLSNNFQYLRPIIS